jgi:hypothetical protein
MAINSGARARAREWSRAIYQAYPTADGIWYPSSVTNQPCAVFYERAKTALPSNPSFHDALCSPRLLPGLSQAAAELNYLLSAI